MALGLDWAIAGLASGWDWTVAALGSGLDGALGLNRAASAVYLHCSVVVSNSHDQFIIGRRLNDRKFGYKPRHKLDGFNCIS